MRWRRKRGRRRECGNDKSHRGEVLRLIIIVAILTMTMMMDQEESESEMKVIKWSNVKSQIVIKWSKVGWWSDVQVTVAHSKSSKQRSSQPRQQPIKV